MKKYLNENQWEHICSHGTIFRCNRCDFKDEMIVTNWPRSADGVLNGEKFAADVFEMTDYWNVSVKPELDPRIGYSLCTIQWKLK